MKKSHVFIILIIAAAIGIIITTAGDASTYASFNDAYQRAVAGNESDLHVVGQLPKDANGNVVGVEEGIDRVSCAFVMVDDQGKQQRVEYNQPMPPDLLSSEKVVVVGHYTGEVFKAEKIILKCPSKYQEQNVKV